MSYASGDPEAKSTRARCIRVVAIVNMMLPGPTNNYEVEKMRNRKFPLTEGNKLTFRNGSDI